MNMNEPKLKILICLLYYLPHRTGMQLYIQRVAEELAQRGHTVTVLCARHLPDLPNDEVINGVRIVRLRVRIPISRGMLMPAYPMAAYELMRDHDVVSIHVPMLETALLSLIGGLTGRKIIPTHHGDLILPTGFVNRAITAVMYGFYRFMAWRAPAVVAYSDDYADNSYYLKPVRKKVRVIYPPITMPEPIPANVAKMRAEWGADGGPLIGYAGRFVQEKRPDVLIKSLDVVLENYPDARIVFAGQYDIPYEKTWELYKPIVDKYSKNLIFLGLHNDMQFMADFFAAMDVLALPSDSECFALVQVEAMLCGTPVVMTDTPGGRVPVQVTGMGEIAPRGDSAAIGRALVDVIGNRERYIRPRHEIEAIFSFQETVDRYEAMFREFAAK